MNITRGKIQQGYKVILYGVEGIGKSTFASQFPEPLFIDTEGSTSFMDVSRLDKPTSWIMLKQQVDFVKSNSVCKTLVIDTVDWAEKLATDFICANGNKKSITQFGYGEGFIQLEEEFGRFLNLLSELSEKGINVVLTAHAKITKFEQPDEMGAYDRYELKLGNKTTAKTAALVKEWGDMVLFANYKTFVVATDDKGTKHKAQGGQRVMYTTHHPAWDAKNRFGFADELPFEFKSISHIFENIVIPQQNGPITKTDGKQDQPHKEVPIESMEQLEHISQEFKEEAKAKMDLTGVPKALADLMAAEFVTKEEIQQVVANKGHFPVNTPFENYPQEYIDGVLIGAWDQVLKEIQQTRSEQSINLADVNAETF